MRTLIIGGDRGIGAALAAKLLQHKNHEVICTSRRYTTLRATSEHVWQVHCDVDETTAITHMAQALKNQFTHIDQLINCAGILHGDDFMPEKSLQQIKPAQMLQSFQTNACGHLAVIAATQSLLTQSKQALVASLSARIGSIGDNHLGGWYAYRMSKAALNMGFKTLSIEWQRKFPQVNFLLLHPGTTDTDLSAPFQKGLPPGQLQSPAETADLLLQQIFRYQQQRHQGVAFIDYAGQAIEW